MSRNKGRGKRPAPFSGSQERAHEPQRDLSREPLAASTLLHNAAWLQGQMASHVRVALYLTDGALVAGFHHLISSGVLSIRCLALQRGLDGLHHQPQVPSNAVDLEAQVGTFTHGGANSHERERGRGAGRRVLSCWPAAVHGSGSTAAGLCRGDKEDDQGLGGVAQEGEGWAAVPATQEASMGGRPLVERKYRYLL